MPDKAKTGNCLLTRALKKQLPIFYKDLYRGVCPGYTGETNDSNMSTTLTTWFIKVASFQGINNTMAQKHDKNFRKKV
jgi:hypothetical protein